MAVVLLVGLDAPTLEGIAQTLAASGHRPALAESLAEAAELAAGSPPLVAVIDRDIAISSADAFRLPLAAGGAIVLYRSSAEDRAPLSASLQRAVLADLTLPLERKRLVALVQHVEERARAAGRDRVQTPPEHRAL
jgi:DNA-binding NtrC family response regulator